MYTDVCSPRTVAVDLKARVKMASTLLNPELSHESAMEPLPEMNSASNAVHRPEAPEPEDSAVQTRPEDSTLLTDSPPQLVTDAVVGSSMPDQQIERKRPLQLLDLPLDILKEIVKEVGSFRLIILTIRLLTRTI